MPSAMKKGKVFLFLPLFPGRLALARGERKKFFGEKAVFAQVFLGDPSPRRSGVFGKEIIERP